MVEGAAFVLLRHIVLVNACMCVVCVYVCVSVIVYIKKFPPQVVCFILFVLFFFHCCVFPCAQGGSCGEQREGCFA